MTFDEALKTGLVFVHFVASAIALASILGADFLILARFPKRLTPRECERIHGAKLVVSAALAVLWVTGVGICLQGYLHDAAYIENENATPS